MSGPLKILVVPDKFKGTLTAAEAAKSIAKGWRSVRPKDRLELLPMSDGGDGFGEVLSTTLGARKQRLQTIDSAHRPCTSEWWWDAGACTAIIETARIIGLAKIVPPGAFHPFEEDTFGIGRAFEAAGKKGARHCLVGIGGSATNDGGFGLARSLGWKFLDRQGREITQWTRLKNLNQLHRPEREIKFASLTVAVDVQNPLLGAKGCSRVYGPQKGLVPADFPEAEKSLSQLAKVVRRDFKRDFASEPGAGAAGGLGFGLAVFLGARLQSGFELFAQIAGLEKRLKTVDLVITGEGAIDKSSRMGKGVGQLAGWCGQLGLPCIGLAGTVKVSKRKHGGFTACHGLTDLTLVEEAKSRPAFWLAELARRAATEYSSETI